MRRELVVVPESPFEIEPTGPVRKCRPGPFVEPTVRVSFEIAEDDEPPLEIAHPLARGFHERVVANEHRVVPDAEQANELVRSIRMVVHSEVDVPVVAAFVAALLSNDEQGGGLLSAAVAPGGVTREQRREQPIAKLAGGV